MKKLFLFVAIVLCSLNAAAQLSFTAPNDTVTGTTANKPCKYNTTSSATSMILATAASDLQVVGICSDGAGTSGRVTVTFSGVVPCIFDNTTVANDYVQVASGGGCHDVGSTRPTSNAILGTVFGAGGSAGTYNVALNKDIYPSNVTAPLTAIGSSDTITAAGAFVTTISVPSTGLAIGSVIEIRAHGIYTTAATASPQFAMQVNAGGTTALCSSGATIVPGLNKTAAPWDLACYIQIVTTGAPGTADPWGSEWLANANGGGVIGPDIWQPGPLSYITNSAQTVSVQETGTPVSGQSFTLQSLFVRVY